MSGIVYLIGAGPGDPKLITVGGREALEKADVVVYDRLAHPRLLNYARTNAERIYVGKEADKHAMSQDGINALLAEKASAGLSVARLKGGDPFVFGRGGEEAEYLRDRGITYVVIPGVTSAIAAPAYAGIPVTHRDLASSFAVITGHERRDGGESGTRVSGESEQRRRWDRIAFAADTLLFLMGVESLDEIVSRLLEHGRDSSTPVALVRWGTWAGRQETLTGVLGSIVEQVRAANFKAPAVTVVGDVVSLRERLRWFDTRPLSGKRIIVTRAREQASEFAELLEAGGAEALEFPLIKLVPPPGGYAALDACIVRVSSYDWICFASAPAVHCFFDRLHQSGSDSRALALARVAAVGPATANALRGHGISPDFLPSTQTGAALADELPGELETKNILVPRALDGDTRLVEILTAKGAVVETAAVYQNMIDADGAEQMRQSLSAGEVDLVTFTSSSTVKNFVEALSASSVPLDLPVACIGPSTAQTASDLLGRAPDIVAAEHTIPGLVAAINEYFSHAGCQR